MAACMNRSYLNTEADDLQTCSLLWTRWSFYLFQKRNKPVLSKNLWDRPCYKLQASPLWCFFRPPGGVQDDGLDQTCWRSVVWLPYSSFLLSSCTLRQIKRKAGTPFLSPASPPRYCRVTHFPHFCVASHGLRGRHLPDRDDLIFSRRSPCCRPPPPPLQNRLQPTSGRL